MIARALDAGAPAAWVAGDEVYGADPGLRADLEHRQMGYVLAVARTHQVITAAGPCQAGTVAARLPRPAWQQYSAGEGAKGHHCYDWAWVSIDPSQPGHRWLLIRRNRRTAELAFYRCHCPHHVPLATLVKVAGRRWTTEENFQAAKGLAGLNEHQVRRWTSWYRWTTLAMLACAFLTITAATEHTAGPSPCGQIPPHPQRNRPAIRHPDPPAIAGPPAPAALVHLAATPPAPRQNLPLPAASPRTMTITIYGWSTSPAPEHGPASPRQTPRRRDACAWL
jgi:SRSO17 transposase